MRFLSLNEVMLEKGDLDCREIGWNKLVLAIICAAMAVVFYLFSRHAPFIGFVDRWHILLGAAVWVLCCGLLLWVFGRTFSPENWLLRTKGLRLWIKYRHFANGHFSKSDLQVIEIDKDEIAWVRKVKKKEIRDQAGEPTGGVNYYLDIALRSPPMGKIQDLLQAERQVKPRKAFEHKENNMPVRLLDGGILRIPWRSPEQMITPGIDKTLHHFQSWVRIEPTLELEENFTEIAIRKLPREEQIQRLREFHESDPREATSLARKLLKLPIDEAKRLLETQSSQTM